MAPLKLCILSSEIVPYAKTGGLADVVGALLQELRQRGHDVRGFMPLYGAVRRSHQELQPVPGLTNVAMTIGGSVYTYSIRAASYPGGAGIAMYFVDCPALFDRPALYTLDADEHRRFLLFTRAAIESCPRLGFVPDLFHCNDWHTAFLPLLLKTVYAAAPGLKARSILTIHNIGYQGLMPAAAAGDLGLGTFEDRLDAGDRAAGLINPLKIGIKFADVVTTVSPTYAREICESPLGMGMQQTLRERSNGVVGILNGVDYREWDPRHDRYLKAHFSSSDLAGKAVNRDELLAANGLRLERSTPLVSMVTRLAEQKGLDLLMEALPVLLQERDFGFLLLGSGDDRYAAFFSALAARFPGRVAFQSGHDESLAHLIEAGSDMFLMPSRYEPCGLNQMYSLRYGTVPIVRKTGGLADSVQHFDPVSGSGTGCVFNDYDVAAVRWGLGTALDWFTDAALWGRVVANAMAQDFSWGRQVLKYEQVYLSAVGGSRASRA